MRRWLRIIGTALAVSGALVLIWAVVVWQWQDPFTALYTLWKQHQLAGQYAKRAAAFRQKELSSSLAAERRDIAFEAERYRLETHDGEAIGKIIVPRMGVNMIMVDGTDHETLKKGPGRDLRTYMPGAVLAHRPHAQGRQDHAAGSIWDLRVSRERRPGRAGERPRGPALAATRAPHPAGMSSTVLRDTSLSRLRAARARRSARRAAVRPFRVGCRDSVEQQIANRLAGRELTVATRHEHERIGSRCARDHVRLLTGDGLQEEAVSGSTSSCTHELVARTVSPHVSREATHLVGRTRLRRALQGAHGGTNEELATDE
jgi:hypothetical protein